MERRYWSVVAFLLPINIFLSELGVYRFRTSIPLLIGFVVLIPSCFIGKKIAVNKENIIMCLPLLAIGILNLLYGIIYMVPTYIAYGFIFSLQLPCFLLKIDKEELMIFAKKFAKWIVVFGAIGLLLATCLVQIDTGQYCGLTGNPNQWGEWQVIIIASSMYLAYSSVSKLQKIAISVVFALAVSNIIFCKSRTTLLATLLVLFAYAIYAIWNKKKFGKQFLCMCLTCILIFPISFYATQNLPVVSNKLLSNLITTNQTSENEVNHNDPTVENLFDSVKDRYTKGISNDSSFSSGRFEIWKVYFSKLRIRGHRPDPLNVYTNGDGELVGLDAHNTFLQIGYQNGWVGMLALIIIVGVLGLFYFKRFLRREITVDELHCAALYLIAGVYMMLSSSFGPYNSFTLIGFWIFSLGCYATSRNSRCMIENIGD